MKMNKLALAMSASLCLSAPALADGLPASTAPFAQLSSSTNQAMDGSVKIVTLENDDGHSGVTLLADKQTVQIEQAGLYFVILAPQVLATEGGVHKGGDPTVGCLDVWSAVNGDDVKNSNVRLCQGVDKETDVVVSQSVAYYRAKDKLTVKVKGPAGVKLEATQPKGEPLIPSIIFTLFKLPG